MTVFYISRHGQTENNENKRLSGWIDTPLTSQGVQNAASTAEKLRGVIFDKIISSDLGRAFVTAYLISRQLSFSEEIERLMELREVNYGDFANTPYAGVNSVYPKLSALDNARFIPPNGESLMHIQQRVMQYLKALSNDNPNSTILIVGHDGTINAVYATFTNLNIGVVDANSHNAHDYVAKFVYEDNAIVSFEEIGI